MFKNKGFKNLIFLLLGPNSDIAKNEIVQTSRTNTFNYSTGLERFTNKSFTWMAADGLLVTLIEKLEGLEHKVQLLEMENNMFKRDRDLSAKMSSTPMPHGLLNTLGTIKPRNKRK